jgi:hypothetical protein
MIPSPAAATIPITSAVVPPAQEWSSSWSLISGTAQRAFEDFPLQLAFERAKPRIVMNTSSGEQRDNP